MGKVGRPKLEVKKDKNILIRVTQEEKDNFKLIASEHNLSVSELIMSLID